MRPLARATWDRHLTYSTEARGIHYPQSCKPEVSPLGIEPITAWLSDVTSRILKPSTPFVHKMALPNSHTDLVWMTHNCIATLARKPSWSFHTSISQPGGSLWKKVEKINFPLEFFPGVASTFLLLKHYWEDFGTTLCLTYVQMFPQNCQLQPF